MDYLIGEIIIFLLASLVLGVIVGWFLREIIYKGGLESVGIPGANQPVEKGLTKTEISSGVVTVTPNAMLATETAMFEETHGQKTDSVVLSYDISVIEGIGKTYRERLRGLEINTTTQLMERCGLNISARSDIAQHVKVIPKVMASWVGMADLMRINGVDGQYAELMNEVGIGNVRQLADSNLDSLYRRMKRLNDVHSVSPRMPDKSKVESWIEQASKLSERVKLS